MKKKYIVRLTESERETLRGIVKTLAGSSQKVRRANILLMADADGPAWTDTRIAEAYHCRRQTIEKLRQRLFQGDFGTVLNGEPRPEPPRAKVLDGVREAKVIALRLGVPPAGFAHWSLRLLAERIVELEIASSISHETVRQTLKKMG